MRLRCPLRCSWYPCGQRRRPFTAPCALEQRESENPAVLLLQPLLFEHAIVVVVYDVYSVCDGGGGGKEQIIPQNPTPTHPPTTLALPSRAMKILSRSVLENPWFTLS